MMMKNEENGLEQDYDKKIEADTEKMSIKLH